MDLVFGKFSKEFARRGGYMRCIGASVMRNISAALIATTILSACAAQGPNGGPGAGAVIGGLLGATAGALTGAQVGKGKGKLAAVAIGTALGGAFGGVFGNYLDQESKRAAEAATQEALSSGGTTKWSTASGKHGEVVPSRSFVDGDGRTCRDYTFVAVIDGRREMIHGTAYLGNDGQWHVMR